MNNAAPKNNPTTPASFQILRHKISEEMSLINFLVKSNELVSFLNNGAEPAGNSKLHARLLDEARALELIHLGSIYVNEKRIKNSYPQSDVEHTALKIGDHLRVHLQPRRFNTSVFVYSKIIIFEHADFIIINKPSGLPVPPTVDNAIENLVHLLSVERNEQIHVTHRLDIPTSGLMFFARNKDVQSKFNKLLLERKVKKYYRAFVSNKYSNDTPYESYPKVLTHYMQPSPRAPKNVSLKSEAGWLECRLKILSHITHTKFTELNIELLTGRPHQIRAQLSSVGYPILGDKMYGGEPLSPNTTSGEPLSLNSTSGEPFPENKLAETLPQNTDAISLESCHLAFKWNNKDYSFEI